jgi:hypothetical protein
MRARRHYCLAVKLHFHELLRPISEAGRNAPLDHTILFFVRQRATRQALQFFNLLGSTALRDGLAFVFAEYL